MQFLAISDDLTLSQLAARVGSRNVDDVLQANGLKRTHDIGAAYNAMCDEAIANYKERSVEGVYSDEVTYNRKMSLLNTLTGEADAFEIAALQDSNSWKVLSATNTLYGYLRIPPSIELPNSSDVIGGDNTGRWRTISVSLMTIFTTASCRLLRNMQEILFSQVLCHSRYAVITPNTGPMRRMKEQRTSSKVSFLANSCDVTAKTSSIRTIKC